MPARAGSTASGQYVNPSTSVASRPHAAAVDTIHGRMPPTSSPVTTLTDSISVTTANARPASRTAAGDSRIGSIASELADHNPLARAHLVDSFERWEAPIRAGLARMRERGDLRPDTDTDALALALLTALQGGLLLTQTRRSTTPLRTGLDAVLAHIRTHAKQ